MPLSIIKNSKILGISCVVPEKEYSLLDNPNLYNGDKKKINRIINSSGFLKRRVVDKNVTTSDLCYCAAEKLIKQLNFDKTQIDGLLFISYTPDFLMPATSYTLHKRLGVSENCVVADIPQACSGYLYGLFQAGMLLNSGCKNVLLLVGDTFSKFTDMFDDASPQVFGDAGSATLITYDENVEPWYFNIKSDGSLYDSLICRNGGFRNPVDKDMFYEDGSFKYKSSMDGAQIFKFTMDRIVPSINELLRFSNAKVSDFSQIVLHQANKFILENIAIQLGISAESIPTSTLCNYGNQCGASIPCVISDLFSDKVSSSDNKFLLSGFGVGLSWISAIVDFNRIYCSKINNYEVLE